MTSPRLETLYTLMAQQQLDAVILNPSPSQFYFSGLHLGLMERPMCLFLVPGKTSVITLPNLEANQVPLASIPLQPFFFGDVSAAWQAVFDQAAAAAGLRKARIGVEPTHMRFLELSYLQQAMPQATFVSAESLIAEMRMAKDEGEIANMQKAVDIAEAALLATLPLMKLGMTEREISAEIGMQMMRAGGEGLSFGAIVSGGPNSANPHAVPTDRPIQRGDLLVIDYGTFYHGYCSDITRTFAVGEVDAELAKIHQVTQAANAAARAFARSGVRAGDVDLAARKVIEEAGYGQYFTHRVGHGLGMEGHEPPYMHNANDLILKPGFTFTIEPGIYLPDYGGVRVEDDVVITADGCHSFTSLPREMVRICD
ncbi:MAG: aminopeptidase P family protein [Anaerolineae bacterium]|nr:aminopeptidase P family protein [Anaerolineae bacterium]